MNERDIQTFFQRAMQPLKNRVYGMIGRAILQVITDGNGIQETQISSLGHTSEKIQRFQEFGFNSVPLKGCEAVFVGLMGSRANSVVVATDDRRYRPQGWAGGESGLYTSDATSVHLKLGGKVLITNSTGELVAAIVDLANWLKNTAQVQTMMGPQPFTVASITALTPIVTKITSFKG